jgi:tetratricopeptide (TPR) repeat protein
MTNNIPRPPPAPLQLIPLIAIFTLCFALAACTPVQQLLFAALPDGTTSVLLGHMEKVDETNRLRIADLESRRDWAGLAKFAEENLAKDHSNPDWWLVSGYAYTQLGNHPKAIASFGESVRLAPDDMMNWNMLGAAYRGAGQNDRAIRTLESALQVRTDSAATYLLLAESYVDAGRDTAAVGAYRDALRLNKELDTAWFGLGRASVRLGRIADAREAITALRPLNAKLATELTGMLPVSSR